jgi:hypothetical protein
VTDQTTAASAADAGERNHRIPLGRTLMWLGIAGASAALTFFVVRTAVTMRKGALPSDETAERIQALIDEANRLIKTLDEKKPQP